MPESDAARQGPDTSDNDLAPSRVRRRSVSRALEFATGDGRDINATQQPRVVKQDLLELGLIHVAGGGRVVIVHASCGQQTSGTTVEAWACRLSER
jgi:hypothetical protein